jgi:hypothetical protein
MPFFGGVALVIVLSLINCCTGQELYMAKSGDCVIFAHTTLQVIDKVKHTEHHAPLTPYFFIM